MSISLSKWPMLPTIALSRMPAMCSARMTSLLPVVVMKMWPSLSTIELGHLVAVHGGLEGADGVDSVTMTANPGRGKLRGSLADVTVATETATLPPIGTSVAQPMPSGSNGGCRIVVELAR